MKEKKIWTSKGQQLPEMAENEAREHIEKLLWPDGPVCPHCQSKEVYKMKGDTIRPGLYRCRNRKCEKPFTVTVGTIFEDSHIPLATWIKAFHLMCSSKKGVSALQLQHNLGLGSYRTAWHMAHRIRLAMKCEPLAGGLTGIVEVDEAYIGARKPRPGTGPHKRGRGTKKAPIVVLVERGGNAHCHPVDAVNAKNLKGAIKELVDKSATIHTDEFSSYIGIGKHFAGGHKVVNHGEGEYSHDGVNTNTAESYFSLLKRGVHGIFHHVSKKHLHRYCSEFEFRWNGRELNDVERRTLALQQAPGKRLMYKGPAEE